MKKIATILLLLVGSVKVMVAQTYTLTVNNGYGSGSYKAGDTVHVWSVAYDSSMTFASWTGDTAFLESPGEWHTTLRMPNQNISVSAVLKNMPAYSIRHEKIKGVNNFKNVYSCFPSNMKGLLYLFHGTGGSASNWISVTEYRSFVDAAIADGYGILVTEAEEITLNTDLNGDGKLRWQVFPMDTVKGNDYLNIKVLTDTFVNRGNISRATRKFSVGMSNGGSYSAAISYIDNFEAGVSYCASSAQAVFNIRKNPFAFRMAKYDDNPEVGPAGNYQAWQEDSTLRARGICHDYKIHDRQPLYPERFARIQGISILTSQAIYNDLLKNNQVNTQHFAIYSDSIKSHILAHPLSYPNFIQLATALQVDVLNQIAASNAEHKFYSDFNFATLNYLDHLCSKTSGVPEITIESLVSLYPNPSNDFVVVQTEKAPAQIEILDMQGRLLKISGETTIPVGDLNNGCYVVKVSMVDGSVWVGRLVKG